MPPDAESSINGMFGEGGVFDQYSNKTRWTVIKTQR